MTSILKVSSIQDPTNSNTALSIDASGIVTTPARPAFYIRKTGAAYTYGTSPIPWDDVVFDTANAWNSSSYRYECPVAGLYWVNICLLYTSDAADE